MINMDKITFTMTVPLDHLETLCGLLSGCLGTSNDDDFNDHITPILKKINNAIAKHTKKQFSTLSTKYYELYTNFNNKEKRLRT